MHSFGPALVVIQADSSKKNLHDSTRISKIKLFFAATRIRSYRLTLFIPGGGGGGFLFATTLDNNGLRELQEYK